MSLLDPRTVILMTSLLGGVMGLVLALLSRAMPQPVPGLRQWTQATGIAFVTALLFGLRGLIPQVLTIVLGNVLLLAAFFMYLAGTHRYFAIKMRWRLWLALSCCSLVLLTWYTYVEDSYRGRLIAVAGLISLIMGYHAWVLVREARVRHPVLSFGQRFTVFWLIALALIHALRWLHAVFFTQGNMHLLNPDLIQSVYAAFYTLEMLMLTVGLSLMASEHLRDQFKYHATHDSLTGVLNRRVVFEALDRELSRSARYQRPFSLLMMDLDHFKEVNDQHGHQMGDRALQHFAQSVQTTLRPNDVLGRFGGEEFIVILPETDALSAQVIAQRIREAVSQTGDSGLPGITVSIGATQWTCDHDDSADKLVARADHALYTAKAEGRNRVVLG